MSEGKLQRSSNGKSRRNICTGAAKRNGATNSSCCCGGTLKSICPEGVADAYIVEISDGYMVGNFTPTGDATYPAQSVVVTRSVDGDCRWTGSIAGGTYVIDGSPAPLLLHLRPQPSPCRWQVWAGGVGPARFWDKSPWTNSPLGTTYLHASGPGSGDVLEVS